MRRPLMSLIFLMVCAIVKAQVTLSVQLPPAGVIQKDQLWNLVVVNSKEEMLDVLVQLELRDVLTGQTVLTASSGSFLLSRGVKMLNASSIQPIQFNYISSDFVGTYIPIGHYNACYRVMHNVGKDPLFLVQECTRITIAPLSPPLLILPEDKKSLASANPLFSWVPPSPLQMFSDLNYDIVIAEVLTGQSPGEAILHNVPVYNNSSLRTLSEIYPSSGTKLDSGKFYAWRITANNGMNPVATTEAWTFILQSSKDSVSREFITYLDLDQKNGGDHIAMDDKLYLRFYSFDMKHRATIKIYDDNGKTVKVVKQELIYGLNFLQIDIKSLPESQTYRCVLTDKGGTEHSIQIYKK